MSSADCSARTARSVRSSGSPGPAPTRVTEPCSTASPRLLASATSAPTSAVDGSRCGSATARAVNNCQNLRRPANDSPDDFTAGRHCTAAATQREKPCGSSASILARIACANTGAAPSVEMPTTSGERLTIEPNEKSQIARLVDHVDRHAGPSRPPSRNPPHPRHRRTRRPRASLPPDRAPPIPGGRCGFRRPADGAQALPVPRTARPNTRPPAHPRPKAIRPSRRPPPSRPRPPPACPRARRTPAGARDAPCAACGSAASSR